MSNNASDIFKSAMASGAEPEQAVDEQPIEQPTEQATGNPADQQAAPDASSLFKDAMGGERTMGEGMKERASNTVNEYAAPVVAVSSLFNPISVSMRATFDALKNGDNWLDAYNANMVNVRKAQNDILKASPVARDLSEGAHMIGSMMFPAGRVAGAIGGFFEGARGAKDWEETLTKGLTGAGAGFTFGHFGSKIAKKIPGSERLRTVLAPKKATEVFNASADNLKNYLKTVKGNTLSEKMVTFGNFLFRKAAVGSGKAVDQVEKMAHAFGNEISKSINKIKSIALKQDPDVDTLKIYGKIKNEIMDMQADDSINAVVRRYFGELSTDTGGPMLGVKSLRKLNKFVSKLKTTVDPLYRKQYDRLTEAQKAIVDSYEIVRGALDDQVEKVIQTAIPEKAGEYAFLRSEGHMIFQLKRLANDRAAELAAKGAQKKAFEGGFWAGTANKIVRGVTPSAKAMQSTRVGLAADATKGALNRGVKVPYALGAVDQMTTKDGPWDDYKE